MRREKIKKRLLAFLGTVSLGLFLSGSLNPESFAAATTPEEYREGMVLQVNLRVRDDEGARWEFNADPATKNITVKITGCPGFGTIGDDCWILAPREYQRAEDWASTGLNPLSPLIVPGTTDTFYIPQEGYLDIGVPDDVDEIKVELIDPTGNFVSIEKMPTTDADTGITIEKTASLDREQDIGTGYLQELNFYVTRDDLNNRLRPGDVPIGVFNQFVTNVGQFSRRAASMLGWSLEITEEGFRNSRIEEVTLTIRDVVNGIIILTIIGLAFMWVFSALIPKNVLRTTTALVALSALTVNFAMPMVRIILDGASVVQSTFLTDEIKEERFLRIENISDVWVGTGVAIMQPRIVQEGQTDVTGQVDIEDRYVDMRQESTLFHSILLFALSLGEAFVAVLLALRIVILWFFLIFSPFFAVLPIFRFTRGVFRYWFWLFGRWLFLGPLIAICLYISISLWQHTGIPIESTFEGFAGTSFLSNTTNIQMYAPGVIRGAGGNMASATELMKFIIGTLMIWYSAIIPFWLTRSKILSNCCPEDKKNKNRAALSKTYFSSGSAPSPTLPPNESKTPPTPILPNKKMNPKLIPKKAPFDIGKEKPNTFHFDVGTISVSQTESDTTRQQQSQNQNVSVNQQQEMQQQNENEDFLTASITAAAQQSEQKPASAQKTTGRQKAEVDVHADVSTSTTAEAYGSAKADIAQQASVGQMESESHMSGEVVANSSKADISALESTSASESTSETATEAAQSTDKIPLESAVSLEDINAEENISASSSEQVQASSVSAATEQAENPTKSEEQVSSASTTSQQQEKEESSASTTENTSGMIAGAEEAKEEYGEAEAPQSYEKESIRNDLESSTEDMIAGEVAAPNTQRESAPEEEYAEATTTGTGHQNEQVMEMEEEYSGAESPQSYEEESIRNDLESSTEDMIAGEVENQFVERGANEGISSQQMMDMEEDNISEGTTSPTDTYGYEAETEHSSIGMKTEDINTPEEMIGLEDELGDAAETQTRAEASAKQEEEERECGVSDEVSGGTSSGVSSGTTSSIKQSDDDQMFVEQKSGGDSLSSEQMMKMEEEDDSGETKRAKAAGSAEGITSLGEEIRSAAETQTRAEASAKNLREQEEEERENGGQAEEPEEMKSSTEEVIVGEVEKRVGAESLNNERWGRMNRKTKTQKTEIINLEDIFEEEKTSDRSTEELIANEISNHQKEPNTQSPEKTMSTIDTEALKEASSQELIEYVKEQKQMEKEFDKEVLTEIYKRADEDETAKEYNNQRKSEATLKEFAGDNSEKTEKEVSEADVLVGKEQKERYDNRIAIAETEKEEFKKKEEEESIINKEEKIAQDAQKTEKILQKTREEELLEQYEEESEKKTEVEEEETEELEEDNNQEEKGDEEEEEEEEEENDKEQESGKANDSEEEEEEGENSNEEESDEQAESEEKTEENIDDQKAISDKKEY